MHRTLIESKCAGARSLRDVGLPTVQLLIVSIGLWVTLSPCLRACRADEDIIDSPMHKSPDMPVPRRVLLFPEGAKELWLKALERPEADIRCQAVDAVALAKRRGFKGLESTIAPLRAALDQPDQQPTVRLAIARTLIELEAKETASSLFQQCRVGDSDLRELV